MLRQIVPCKINIQKTIQNTLKDQNIINVDNFNFDANGRLPIILNKQPIGYIVNDKESVLWLDITPEFMQIDDKWNLSGLHVNVRNEELAEIKFENGNNIKTTGKNSDATRSRIKQLQL